MQKKYYLPAFLIFLLTAFTACAQSSTEKCAVAFYNLENLFDPADDPARHDEDFTPSGVNHYTREIYQQKLHNMATVLSKIAVDKIPEGPALYGLAEIENEQVLLDLVSQPELSRRNLKIVHFESPDTRGIDVALLYHPGRFRLLTATAVPVDITEKGRKEYTRDILLTKGLLGTDTVYIMVCHWPSRRGGEASSRWKRNKAAGICRKIADSIFAANMATPVIIMGDMNDDPVSESITKVIGARSKEKEIRPGSFFNPWVKYYRRGTGTLSFNDSWNLFDQIILSYSFVDRASKGWKFTSAEIFDRAFLKTSFGKYKGYPHRSFSGNTWINGYSDHFPTCIYLSK